MFSKQTLEAHEVTFRRIIRRTFLLPVGVLLFAAVCLAWLVSHLLTVSNWVDHTDRVISQARRCESLAVDMETGMRGFLLTGDAEFLKTFNQGKAEIGGAIDDLSRNVADNPQQAAKLMAIQAGINRWMSFAQEMIGRRQRGGDYQNIPDNVHGKVLMDDLRHQFAVFMSIEHALRQQRIANVQQLERDIRRFRWVVLLVLGLAIGEYFRRQLGAVGRLYDRALVEAKIKFDAFQASEASLREAQAQLRRHADELEKTVAQRTAKLQETIGELESYSYSISHDLRAPLRAMQGYAKVLLEDFQGKIGPDGKAFLDRIIASASRMDKLIQDILGYSRVTRAELTAEPVDLDKLVRDIIQQYPNLNSLNGDIKIEGHLPKVNAPEALVTQCIANLLNNAVKFTAVGVPAKVKIWAETENADVRLWVEDNGIGIAPKYQERIFGVFERIPGERPYEGTGIGLAIVRKAVERMGGSVGVESELGKGSKFWILLPGRKL